MKALEGRQTQYDQVLKLWETAKEKDPSKKLEDLDKTVLSYLHQSRVTQKKEFGTTSVTLPKSVEERKLRSEEGIVREFICSEGQKKEKQTVAIMKKEMTKLGIQNKEGKQLSWKEKGLLDACMGGGRGRGGANKKGKGSKEPITETDTGRKEKRETTKAGGMGNEGTEGRELLRVGKVSAYAGEEGKETRPRTESTTE